MTRSTVAAKWIFRLAAIYGLIVILPFYGLEQRIGRDTPPPITHPEYFYGFVGATVSIDVDALSGTVVKADGSIERPATTDFRYSHMILYSPDFRRNQRIAP